MRCGSGGIKISSSDTLNGVFLFCQCIDDLVKMVDRYYNDMKHKSDEAIKEYNRLIDILTPLRVKDRLKGSSKGSIG